MNTYIINGFGIGIAVILFLLRFVFRKDKTYDSENYRVSNSLVNDENLKVKVREYLAKEKKIEGIKYVRDKTRTGLIESKKYVEDIERNIITTNNTFDKIGSINESVADCNASTGKGISK